MSKLDLLQFTSNQLIGLGARNLQVDQTKLPPEFINQKGLFKYQLAITFGLESGLISSAEAADYQKLLKEHFDQQVYLSALQEIPDQVMQNWFSQS